MLQDMVAKNDVKPIVLQRNIVQIKMYIRNGRNDISGEIIEIFLFFKIRQKALLRCDVKKGQFFRSKQIGFPLQVQPNQAVAL